MKQEGCQLCFIPEKYQKFDIKEYKNWNVTLFDNQYYLGRSIIYLKRHEADILDITKEERDEVFEIAKEIRSSLNSLF